MYILAGANGSGKSTIYDKIIKPQVNAPFINADVIQKTELKNPDLKASYEAAQIANKRRDQYMRERKSFVTETVFSHESKLDLIAQAKKAGFQVALYHVGLRNADLNVARVGLRVKKGGHDVPEDKIRARRERGEALISEAARQSDRAFVYDNSTFNRDPLLGIEFRKGKVVGVGENLPKWQREVYKSDLSRFSEARLNPAAASYNIVDRMAKDITGDKNVRAAIPKRGGTYRGNLVGESARHYLQSTSASMFVAHFKDVIGKGHKLGTTKEIKYKTLHKAEVKDIQEGRKPDPAIDVSRVNTKTVSINDAQASLKEHSAAAKKSFQTELADAEKSGSVSAVDKAKKRLNALKLAPAMLSKLKTEGVPSLQVQTPNVKSSANTVTSIIKAGAETYRKKGFGRNLPTQSRNR